MYKKLEGKPTIALEKIKGSFDRLNEKMDVMIEIHKHSQRENSVIPDVLDVMTLMSLPDHLRKTAVTLCKLGRATASEVARRTGIKKAAQSRYLNQLESMGYVKKDKKGNKTYFYVED